MHAHMYCFQADDNTLLHEMRILRLMQWTANGISAGLLSALYTKNGKEVACPDPKAGLYIRCQDDTAVKVPIPASHIAYQMGEAMQVGPIAWLVSFKL